MALTLGLVLSPLMKAALPTVTSLALLLAVLAVFWLLNGRPLFAAILAGMGVMFFLMRPLIRWAERRVAERHAARRTAELGVPNA